MLAAALRRNIGDGAFEHFQQGLLDAFAGDIAGDADVVLRFADLVDFVDVDDAALGGFEIVVGVLQKLEEDVLDVFADVAGFGEGGGVADGEGDVENARQGFGEQGFAAAGGADQKDIALIDFDIRDRWAPELVRAGWPDRSAARSGGFGGASDACNDYAPRRRAPFWRSCWPTTY